MPIKIRGHHWQDLLFGDTCAPRRSKPNPLAHTGASGTAGISIAARTPTLEATNFAEVL